MKAKYKQCRYNGKRMRTHIAVYLLYMGWSRLPEGMTLHHINFDRFDNDIGNLQLLTRSEHSRIHAKMQKRNHGRFA